MKRLIQFWTLAILSACALAQTNPTYVGAVGWCHLGGQAAVTQGLATSGTQPLAGSPFEKATGVMASYPKCTVSVFPTGQVTPAQIFATSGGATLSNPFTANVDGSFQFYVLPGCYDITISSGITTGSTMPSNHSDSDICFGSSASTTAACPTNILGALAYASGAGVILCDNALTTDTHGNATGQSFTAVAPWNGDSTVTATGVRSPNALPGSTWAWTAPNVITTAVRNLVPPSPCAVGQGLQVLNQFTDPTNTLTDTWSCANFTSSGSVASTYRTCVLLYGADNGAGLANLDIGPQGRQCFLPYNATVVQVEVAADTGTPSVMLADNHQGSDTNILSASLTTGSNGGVACATTGGGLGFDGVTTCAATLQNTSALQGDYFEAVSGTASGAHRMSIFITFTQPNFTSGGTVTSVGLAGPTGFGISNSPVLTAGTLTFAMPASWTTGDLLLGNGSNSVTRLGIGSNNTVLTSNGTTASWQAAGAGAVSSVNGQTGAVVLNNTIGVPTGGSMVYDGMLGWWQAGCTVLSSGGTCASLGNGTSIDYWMDLSGRSAHMVPASGSCTIATSVAAINNQTAMSFNGSCGEYRVVATNDTAAAYAPAWTGGLTMFAIAKSASCAANDGIISGNTTAVYWRIAGAAKSKEQQFGKSNTSDLGNGTAACDTNWHKFMVQCSESANVGSSVQPVFRLDGASDATISGANCSGLDSNGNMAIDSIGYNRGAVADVFNGSIAEIIVYGRALSSSEITTVESYLHTKYGL